VLPKPSPVPDELSKPFWDACNEERLVIQNCTDCDRMQHPPQPKCVSCGSADHLEWRAMSGRGRITGYCVQHDSRIVSLKEEQPFNLVIIELEDDPDIKMFSHLPGTPVGEVPVGANVQVEFEETATTGQKVPEWRVVA
jgi:uncharacterized OB-fold protein